MTQQHEENLVKVALALRELMEDAAVPRNIKIKLEGITVCLGNGSEMSLKINKVLNELDEIVNDINLQSHTRTQIWGIVSILENTTQTAE
ncbi:UPF0147 family protein [Candidatus Woesearchaeota archaeon]|nr:UPF0147 family protein [Candidatus Woesearchaeota archaeon]